MPGRIDVEGSRLLQAAILSLRVAPTEVRKQVRQVSKRALEPEFTKQIAERAAMSNQPRLSSAVLVRGARIQVSDQNVRMRTAASTRALKGGLVPNAYGKAIEFGANAGKVSTYTRRSPKGKPHQVKRHTTRQWPRVRRQGWAFYPTVENLLPRFAALWTQTAIRTVHEALEGRR
ncbi:hypothetical protein [Agrococcus jejuensis]|uniref:hypothetical protein n=1 Tax=Agrococcus jejuensis TaxID=399736 RepID=UPI00119F6368|nr:hypothetical protein [Agrococcus jejuensis]